VVNQLQGKYEVDDNGLVTGTNVDEGVTMSDFEKKITDALSSPKANQPISNDSDYYRNDTDMIPTNESYR
jgi:hypothetical protein